MNTIPNLFNLVDKIYSAIIKNKLAMKLSKASGKNFAEFFAGIGLMRMGLERGGWRIAFANDIDEDKQRMYQDHFGSGKEFILGDVYKLDADEIPNISLATASFPCNDLSLAGARRGLAGDPAPIFI